MTYLTVYQSHFVIFSLMTLFFYAQAPTINSAQVNLQNDTNNVVEWLNNNRLNVNVSKSSCMVVNTHPNSAPFTLSINDTRLDNVDQFKYLGVQLTNTLSWNAHISYICRKLGHSIQILRKLKGIINANDLLIVHVYKTLVQPHIDYCITVWGYAPNCHIKKLQRLQNKIVRILKGDFNWESSPSLMLTELNIPNIIQRRDYFIGIQVFRCLNDLYPPYISDMLQYANEYNDYMTRSTQNDSRYVPKARINVFKQSFQYTAPSMYNALPNVIKELMYSSNHFNIQPHQYTMHYLMLLKNLQLCHVLNPNSKSMLLIASMLLLSRFSVQYTVYYFNDFIMFYMYWYNVYIMYIIYIYMYICICFTYMLFLFFFDWAPSENTILLVDY